MKALVLKEYMNLVYEEVPEPEIGVGEVLIAVKACGICGSDVRGMDGSSGRRIPPLIMGHEASGVIAEIGPGVAGWTVGERVTFDSTIYCGTCWYCRRGEINLCNNRRVLGVSPGEYRQHGAFADYIAVPSRILYRLPENLSFEKATFVEALSIAVHAVDRTPVMLNDSALVLGAGTIGLLAIQALRSCGCGLIIAADIDENRLSLARKLGADITINSAETDLHQDVLDHTGRGVDIAIEAVGIASTVEAASTALRKGGALTLIGNISPKAGIPVQMVVTREISVNGSCASRGEYPACIDLISRGVVNVDAMISAVAVLSDGPAWFRRLYDGHGKLMKVILIPWEELR